jgi:CheY-like chemotaxis protein
MIKRWRKKDKPADNPLIAIIDDEEDLCQLLKLALVHKGYEAVMAFDGEAGLALVRSRHPSLILLDIKMPRMNGYQLLARIQQDPALAGIPVIVMTSLADDGEKTAQQWAASLGIVSFIPKPMDPEIIVQAIQDQLGKV